MHGNILKETEYFKSQNFNQKHFSTCMQKQITSFTWEPQILQELTLYLSLNELGDNVVSKQEEKGLSFAYRGDTSAYFEKQTCFTSAA